MKLVFSEHAWEDYLHWQRTDRRALRRINTLIKETQRAPYEGIGKLEPLKHGLSGYWSRRINDEHCMWSIRLQKTPCFSPNSVITIDFHTRIQRNRTQMSAAPRTD